MTRKPTTNTAASVRQRLLNLGRSSGDDFQLLLTRYGIERLLDRLSRSEHASRFVLKGATLFTVWTGELHRPTRDLDLLGLGDWRPERLLEVFRSLSHLRVPDDGLVFSAASVSIEPIREHQEYDGYRVKLNASLGQARLDLQVDVGFGDAITPKAEIVAFPSLLGMDQPLLHAYPRETVIAGKLEAMVKLAIANTRMKDFFDLAVLAKSFPYSVALLLDAIAATFHRRGTTIPSAMPIALTSAFADDSAKLSQWKAFVGRNQLEGRAGDLSRVVAELRDFLAPPMFAAGTIARFDHAWKAGGPWEPS